MSESSSVTLRSSNLLSTSQTESFYVHGPDQYDQNFQTTIFTPTVSRKKAFRYSLSSKFDYEKLQKEINKLIKYCGIEEKPFISEGGSRLVLTEVKFLPAIRILERIVYRTENSVLQRCPVDKLIMCCLALSKEAYESVKVFSNVTPVHLRRVRIAEMNYFRVVWLLTPEKTDVITSTLICYLTDWHLWDASMLCMGVMRRLILCHVALDTVLSSLLSLVKNFIRNSTEPEAEVQGRCVLRVLHEMLKHGAPRCSMSGMVNLTENILELLYESVCADSTNAATKNLKMLQRGLEVCARRAMERFDDDTLLDIIRLMLDRLDTGLNDMQIMDYGGVLEYAVLLYRILQRFLDRHNNLLSFISPELYLENLTFNIVVGSFRSADKVFLLEYREQLHETLLKIVRHHGQYQAEANLLPESKLVEMSWRHATVVGVISLVCWTHHAVTLYKYVESIISRRGRQAPHLNPPLKLKYAVASHHVLWQKPDLYFEAWELRYALWKHFRCKSMVGHDSDEE
ncbi:uncharacterized protein LOC113374663 [Ctenocephalides felis]|uniref:uncharacterized protein LOC113374663 n=1 Tax=Ctenocephalides felis TaxID=7515 RepID=UPI000E6E2117|nr:uncharacterized protein LOC113374663 [Ctenocephalides felis]